MTHPSTRKPLRVLLACGGTGGHIFPAFSVAEEIKKNHPDAHIVFICGKKDIEDAIFRMIGGEKVYSVESAPFRGSRSLMSPAFLLKLWRGFFYSLRILSQEKPAVVVGFGGHYSFPVIAAARCLGIRTMIHEQNVMPGVANKVLTRMVHAVALSFEQTKKYLPGHRRMRVTGNPIRSFIERDCRQEALQFFSFLPHKTTLLVLGGSQGAESINTVFLEALKQLSARTRENLQVIHLCGKMIPEEARRACGESGVDCRAFSFFERMDMAYGAADFALGRAGATFLAEMTAKRLPAILVPYPFAGGHQRLNAEAFLKDGISIMIEQNDLKTASLASALESFFSRARSAESAPAGGANRAVEAGDFNSRTRLLRLIEELA